MCMNRVLGPYFTIKDVGQWRAWDGAPPFFLCDGKGDGQVAEGLSGRYQDQEEDEIDSHDAGGKGQGIPDDGHPGQQEADRPKAVEPAGGPGKLFLRDADHLSDKKFAAPQPQAVVDHRAQHIAAGGHRHGHQGIKAVGQQQPQQHLGTHGKDRGCQERGDEQAGKAELD